MPPAGEVLFRSCSRSKLIPEEETMKYLMTCVFVLPVMLLAGQGGHSFRFEKLVKPDSLHLEVSTIVFSGGKQIGGKDTCSLQYDPINQFPYYQLLHTRNSHDDSLFLDVRISSFRGKGNLLLYWLDSDDIPHILASMCGDSLPVSPDRSWRLKLPAGSVTYLVGLLSNQPVNDPAGLLSSMEFTYGSLIYRQKQVFGSGQIPANPEWRLFLSKHTGAEWEPSMLQSSHFAYLPILFSIHRD